MPFTPYTKGENAADKKKDSKGKKAEGKADKKADKKKK
jgi:hypothetical protein